jgi:GNAT superfamily N-acetyltransferase
MIIRPATHDDIPQAVELIRTFQKNSLNDYNLYFDEAYSNAILNKSVDTTLVAEVEGQVVGLISGLIVNYPLNDQKIFQETIWFVAEKYRNVGIKLLKELERVAKEKWGCAKLVMVYIGNSKPDKLHKFYERIGFRMLETHFIKELV